MHPSSNASTGHRWSSNRNILYFLFILWLMLLLSSIYLFKIFAFGPHHEKSINIRHAPPPRVKAQVTRDETTIVNPVKVQVTRDEKTIVNPVNRKRELPRAAMSDDDPDYKRIVDKDQAILIVGGTDGSGTRKVVQVLEYLGANMVVDDMGTYDIHAEIVKGWPKIVAPVIDITRSLHYDIYNDIPDDVRYNTTRSLQILLKETEDKIAKKSLPVPKNISAKSVYFGFKAPVSMALLPFWVHAVPKMKFVHIIRDGRDIAFSDNTGPIRKFFTCTYGPNNKYEKDKNEAKAIRLWNDQNVQVHKFIDNFRETSVNGSAIGSTSFDYFTIRTEDLLAQNHGVRFNTLKQLAQFIGSNASDNDICCLATQGSLALRRKDTRIIGRSGLKAESRLKYGKWKAKLRENKNLQSTFDIATEALEIFGYEPELVYKDVDSHICAGVVCKKSPSLIGKSSAKGPRSRADILNSRKSAPKKK